MFEQTYRHPSPDCAATADRKSRRAIALLGLALAATTIGGVSEAASTRLSGSPQSGAINQQLILQDLNPSLAAGNSIHSTNLDVQEFLDEGRAERIFQHHELVSPRSVASLSRTAQAVKAFDSAGWLTPMFLPRGHGYPGAGATDLSGRDLSNAIFTLRSGGTTRATSSGSDPLGVLWEEPGSTLSDFSYTDLPVDAAAGASAALAPGNVLIPLPMAAWSALSVLGGVGVLAGLRKLGPVLR